MHKQLQAAPGHHSRYSRWHRAMAIGIMAAVSALTFLLPVAARGTYVITDGAQVVVHTTLSRDYAEVLAEAGVKLGVSDTYTAEENGDHFDLVIQRQQYVRLYVDGSVRTVRTYGETVEEMLKDEGITLGENDKVSVPLDTPTETGLYVRVTRVTTETVTYDEVIPAEERVFLNTVLQPGQETVLEEGSDGLASVTAEITYEDGKEVSREVLSETVVTPSKDRMVIRGEETAAMPQDAEGNAIITAGGEVLEYSRVIDGKATAYNCPGYVGHTASGTVAEVGKVAVDPSVIPLGSKLYVVSQDGQYVYGYCIAEDTGGLIKGNKVDLYFATWDECIQFGYRPVTIYVVEP